MLFEAGGSLYFGPAIRYLLVSDLPYVQYTTPNVERAPLPSLLTGILGVAESVELAVLLLVQQ